MKKAILTMIYVVGAILIAVSGCGITETSVNSANINQQDMESSQESDDAGDATETFFG